MVRKASRRRGESTFARSSGSPLSSALRAGASGFVVKPFNAEKVLRTIHAALRAPIPECQPEPEVEAATEPAPDTDAQGAAEPEAAAEGTENPAPDVQDAPDAPSEKAA